VLEHLVQGIIEGKRANFGVTLFCGCFVRYDTDGMIEGYWDKKNGV